MRLILAVGEGLDLFIAAPFVVSRDDLIFGCFFDGFVAVAADVAEGGLVVFEGGGEALDGIFAAIFGHGRDGHADDFAVVHGIKALAGGADGFFDRGDHVLLEGLHENYLGLWGGELGDL